jgi:MoaA/NifB/PqqE/SkfB family radical SAM enzyme
MDLAHKNGFDVRINSTVTKDNISHLQELVRLTAQHYSSQVNLNLVFLEGNAKNEKDITVTPETWLQQYYQIADWAKQYRVQIKTPYGFANIAAPSNEKEIAALTHKIFHRAYCLIDGREYNCLLFLEHGCACKEAVPFCGNLPSCDNQCPYCLDYKVRLQ